MGVVDEFATVKILLGSAADTRAVDAFALSLIKAEKQARRLVTYLIYQHPWCGPSTVPRLRDALEKSTGVYFDGLLNGWDALYPRSVRQLVGTEYPRLRNRLSAATLHRNKIFHGQLTAHSLRKSELVMLATDIRNWCEALGTAAQSEVGYDGCGRNSFRKSPNAAVLCAKYKVLLTGLAGYRQFIKAHLERP